MTIVGYIISIYQVIPLYERKDKITYNGEFIFDITFCNKAISYEYYVKCCFVIKFMQAGRGALCTQAQPRDFDPSSEE